MAEEKKLQDELLKDGLLQDELLSDEQLDNVAGGTYMDSFNVSNFLYQAGFKDVLKDNGSVNFEGMRKALNSMGIQSDDHGGLKIFGARENSYKIIGTDQTLDQAGMMKYLREKFPDVKYKEINF